MKFQGKHVYLYVGRNGFIVALDFHFRSKSYSVEYTLFFCRFSVEEEEVEV